MTRQSKVVKKTRTKSKKKPQNKTKKSKLKRTSSSKTKKTKKKEGKKSSKTKKSKKKTKVSQKKKKGKKDDKNKKSKKDKKQKKHLFTLKNGLDCLMVDNKNYKNVCIMIGVKTGSIHEIPECFGIAHYLEHLLFRGTENYGSQKKIAEKIERNGGVMNATTSNEKTKYYIQTKACSAKISLEILADMMFNSKLNCVDIELERRIVSNEKNQWDDDVSEYMSDKGLEFFTRNTVYKSPIIGKEKSIQNLQRYHFLMYLQTHYKPENMFLVLYGNMNKHFDDTKKAVHKYFDIKNPLQNYQLILNSKDEVAAKKFKDKLEKRMKQVDKIKLYSNKVFTRSIKIEINKNLKQNYFEIMFPSLPMNHPKQKIQSILLSVLSMGMSSKLFSNIREKTGLVYKLRARDVDYTKCGYVSIYGNSSGGKTEINQLFNAIFNQLTLLKEESLSTTDFYSNMLKKITRGSLEKPSTISKANSKLNKYLFLKNGNRKKKMNSKDKIKITDISAKHLQNMANQLFKKEHMSIFIYTPNSITAKDITLNLK